MKTMADVMDQSVKEDEIPKNLLHLFQVCTSDFGMDGDLEYLQGRRINFIFAMK